MASSATAPSSEDYPVSHCVRTGPNNATQSPRYSRRCALVLVCHLPAQRWSGWDPWSVVADPTRRLLPHTAARWACSRCDRRVTLTVGNADATTTCEGWPETVATTDAESSTTSDFGANEWLVEDMYERYQADPDSVDAAWHDFFADYRPAPAPATEPSSNGATEPTGEPAPEAAGRADDATPRPRARSQARAEAGDQARAKPEATESKPEAKAEPKVETKPAAAKQDSTPTPSRRRRTTSRPSRPLRCAAPPRASWRTWRPR